jgi:hypothetical protein
VKETLSLGKEEDGSNEATIGISSLRVIYRTSVRVPPVDA